VILRIINIFLIIVRKPEDFFSGFFLPLKYSCYDFVGNKAKNRTIKNPSAHLSAFGFAIPNKPTLKNQKSLNLFQGVKKEMILNQKNIY